MKQQLLCMLTSEAWKCKFSSEIQLCHYGQNLQITLHTGMFYTKHEKVGFFTTSVQAPGCSSHMDWHGSCPERYNGQSKQFCCPFLQLRFKNATWNSLHPMARVPQMALGRQWRDVQTPLCWEVRTLWMADTYTRLSLYLMTLYSCNHWNPSQEQERFIKY